ncbi:MAG: hypothetical protein R3B99_15005 [Polyangiales bacterium]
MRLLVRVGAFVGMLLLAACADDVPTQVLLRFDADEVSRASARSMRVRLFALPDETLRYDESHPIGSGEGEVRFPTTVPVVPFEGDASRRFRVLGELSSASGAVFATVQEDVGFSANARREVALYFASAPLADGGPDTGVPDAGGSDVGVPDADVPDGGDPCGACPCSDDRCVDGACAPARRVVFVSTGSSHTCAVEQDGTAHCFGSNEGGQLGVGASLESRLVPTPLRETTRWVDDTTSVQEAVPRFAEVHAGAGFTCARAADGAPHCWGRNANQCLGIGPFGTPSTGDQVYPVRIEGLTVATLSVGRRSTCSIGESAAGLFCWGLTDRGQCADDTLPQYAMPHRSSTATDWLEVSQGTDHACGIRSSGPGAMYCWGETDNGRIGSRGSAAGDQFSPARLGGTWRHVAAGGRHTCAIDFEGRMRCFGDNANGQLGLGHTDSIFGPQEVDGMHVDWTGVAAGENHSCGLRGERLFCWGGNLAGALGAGPTAPPLSALPLAVEGRWLSVSAGESHTCAIDVVGALHCFGRGAAGRLGNGDTDDRSEPARVCFPPRE